MHGLCGHNIIDHDIKYIKPFLRREYILIDTLYLSPLLFPRKPYHNLLKDDKILSEVEQPMSPFDEESGLYASSIIVNILPRTSSIVPAPLISSYLPTFL